MNEAKPSPRLLIASSHRYPDLARLWYRHVSREVIPAFRAKGLEVETRIFRDANIEAFDPERFPEAFLDAPRPEARDFLEFHDAVLELGHDFILFLDADLFILDGTWAAALMDQFEDPDLAAISLLRRSAQPGLFALLFRAAHYRALPKPVLACRYEGLMRPGRGVNLQPGDWAARRLRATGQRILDVPAEEAQTRLADFHGTTVVRASRELFGVFLGDRFDRLGGDRRYFAMGAYDNTLLGTFYKTLYGEAFAVGPDGTHLEGSVTIESLRENLARCHSLGLLLRLTAYFERSKRALARLAAYEELRVRPPRAFSFTRECLLRAAVKILPNALTRADKGFLAQAKALVSRIAFGSVEFGLFGPIGLREPQEEVRVWLCGLGSPRDVTYRNVIANSKPHTIGFGLDGESQKIDTGTRLELKFEERTGERRLLAEIDLTCRDSIDLTDGQIALFQSAKCRNFCLPRTLLWRQYLRWAYHRWRTRDRDDPDHRLSTREVHAMFAFYICPRPVFLVSVADGDTSNLFPMDLLGIVGAEHFSLTLKSTSTAVPLLRQARRAALVSVPIEQTDLVYGLGPNHRKQDFVWDKAPFGVRTSPAFGLPVPDFSLRVRDMEVTDIRELGSHQFFICRIVEDRRFVDGDEFFESHSFYQAWKHRQRGSTPEPS